MRPVNRNSSLYFNAPKYQFRAPPEFGGRELLHPVVIVGAGPVGVTAALELSRHGVVSVVIDDKDTVNDGSRAICIARHSIECLQQLGVEQRFVHKALPWTHGTSYYRDQPVYRLQMPHSEHERFHPMYNLQQQYIEQFLIDRAQEDPLIDLRWCSRLVDPDQNDEQASLRVETPAGTYTLLSR
jgi:3-(3-hydroxy-phenyl)propionate hydroxylase